MADTRAESIEKALVGLRRAVGAYAAEHKVDVCSCPTCDLTRAAMAEADRALAASPSPDTAPVVYADPDAANQAFNDLRRERDVALARAEVLRTALRDLTAECTDDPDEDDWRYQRAIERAEKLLARWGSPGPEQCPHCNRAVTEAISTAGCKGHHLSAPVCEDCKGGGWRTIRTWMGDGIGWQEQAVNCWCGTPPAPAPPPRQEPGACPRPHHLLMAGEKCPTCAAPAPSPRQEPGCLCVVAVDGATYESMAEPGPQHDRRCVKYMPAGPSPAPRQEQEGRCEGCAGDGVVRISDDRDATCPRCHGTGRRPAQADGGGHG